MTSLAIEYVPPNRNEEGRIVGIDVAVRTLLEALAAIRRTKDLIVVPRASKLLKNCEAI